MITRPMLAPNKSCHEYFDQLKFPLIVSPKIDGIRCYKANDEAKTRSGKPQPNPWVRKHIEHYLPNGIDGELTCGQDFRESTSALRRGYDEPNFTFHIFDWVENSLETSFRLRIARLHEVTKWLPSWSLIIPQIWVSNLEELLKIEDRWIQEGYEGVMVRNPDGRYKCNRATVKESLIYKLKRFVDAEAYIVGMVEQEENCNEAFTDDLGFTKRSQCQEGKVGKGTLGTLKVRDCVTGVCFDIGIGLGWTKEFRQEMWNTQQQQIGKVITYKHLPHGNYDVPRNASMKGFRDDFDR